MTGPIVTGVDFVCVPTKALPAARQFYTEVLGLTPSSVWQRPGQDALGAEFETGGVTLALLDCAALGIEFSPNKVPIALQVEDVETARTELESRGITFLADTLDSGVCLQALFKDPDGNALDLHHRYAPHGGS